MRSLILPAWLFYLLHPRHETRMRLAPENLLDRARSAIRTGDAAVAESIIAECGEAAETDPDCLNVRGLIAELRGQWAQARSCWVRAARHSEPGHAARQNLRRYFELFEFGRTVVPAALGDEPNVEICSQRL
jgi:hypothetical protein